MCKFKYDFSNGITLNILIIYGKDPNIKKRIFWSSNYKIARSYVFPYYAGVRLPLQTAA